MHYGGRLKTLRILGMDRLSEEKEKVFRAFREQGVL